MVKDFIRQFSLIIVCFLFVGIFFLVEDSFSASCPTKPIIQQGIKKSFGQKVEIVNIKPTKMPGLCQIQIKFRGRNMLMYSDSKGDYLIAGKLFDAKTGRNLTRETVAEINRLTKDELKRLDKLTAFTVGDKGPVVYFVTDPQCPYCKKAEKILEPMAKAGKLTVKYILFPLRFHKGAKEECISIICDNKGLEGFKNRYRSDNQCEKGKKQVEESISFLMAKGISGTPTYIFSDGRYHSGVMSQKALEDKLSKINKK